MTFAPRKTKLKTFLRCSAAAGLLAGSICLPMGCTWAGYGADIIPPADIAAAYPGLKDQHVEIMVWADRGVSGDHPSIEPDLARGLQDKLQQAQDAKADEVQNVRWVNADEVLRFQENHPEIQFDPVEKVAPRLPGTRLIYVEVASFSLHPNDVPDLSRGTADLMLKVVEVNGKVPKVAYQEQDISVVYPPNSPPEGVPDLQDAQVYHKTIDAMTTELAKRFITHPPEQTFQ